MELQSGVGLEADRVSNHWFMEWLWVDVHFHNAGQCHPSMHQIWINSLSIMIKLNLEKASRNSITISGHPSVQYFKVEMYTIDTSCLCVHDITTAIGQSPIGNIGFIYDYVVHQGQWFSNDVKVIKSSCF